MRIKLLLFFVIFFVQLGVAQVKEGLIIPKNPKIGLALSGGGAKGFAHVGVLKVLDSLGVEVDYISGTSMGAIVGGLYASGYSANEIEDIILNTDFYSVLANEKNRQEASFFTKATDKYLISLPIKNGKINFLPRSFSKGQKNIYMLKDLFKNVSNITDFSQLPIPFMCVATNLETGKEKLFESGDLVSSIMASSAFPSLLDPVKIGDSLYIDGAITINYPAKPLKDKGMDIVIGVDLSQGLASRKKLTSLIDILNQVIDFGIQKETKIQETYTDLNIHPNLKDFNATSYSDKHQILEAGYKETEKYLSILEKLPKKESSYSRIPIHSLFSNVYKIDSLDVTHNRIFNKAYIQGKLGLQLPSMQTYGSINKMIDKLYATNNYTLINYDILQHENKNYLHLDVAEDDTRAFLKFGLHYDEVFHTGLLSNFTVKRLLFRNATLSVDGIVGDSPRYYLNYFIDNGYIPGFGINSSGLSLKLRDAFSNIYEQRTWYRNEIFIQSVWKDRYAIGAGFSADYFDRKISASYQNSENYLNAYIFLKTDSQDDIEFPTRGIYMNLEGKVIDLFNSDLEKKTLQAKAKLAFHIPLSSVLTTSIKSFAGFTLGKTENYYYQYGLGGIFEQNLANFTRFDGYNFGQILSDNLLTTSALLQYQLQKNIFLIGSFNIANPFENLEIKEIFRVKESSVSLTAGYKSPFGQIKINVAKAFNPNKVMFNVILGHWF